MFIKRDNVLDVNPPANLVGSRTLTLGGSHWLWFPTAVFILSFLALAGLSLIRRTGERIFYYLFTIGLFTGAVAYYAMASNLGWSLIPTHLNSGDALAYTVFFAKYIYWVVSFPIAAMALGLASGVSWASIVYNVFLSWAWVISYLVGAYTPTRYKWGFFTLGTLAYFLLAFSTMISGLSASRRFTLTRDYTILAGYVNVLWFLYPIGWAVTDGGNVMGVTQMAIYFGILDLLLLPGLTVGFLLLSRRWDHGAMNLHFTQYGRVPAASGTYTEKATHAPVAGATTTGGTTTDTAPTAGPVATSPTVDDPAASATGGAPTARATTGRQPQGQTTAAPAMTTA